MGVRERRQLERRFLKLRLAGDKLRLQEINKCIAKMVHRAKNDFYEDIINASNSQTKSVYNLMSILSNNPEGKIPSHLKAEDFADFFNAKVANIVREFPPVGQASRQDSYADFQFQSFLPVSANDLKQITLKCSSNDQMPTWFMRSVYPYLTEPIIKLVNDSFVTGQFPSVLKTATLIPIIKDRNGDVNQMKNYRPVSLISCFSKILEKLASVQLSNHIEVNQLGNLRQSAYKPKHSVETSLLSLHSELLEVLDRRNDAFLVLLDLSAAFDTVNHEMLLDVLNIDYHVTGVALDWFKSYLLSRTFRVRLGGDFSASRPLATGVPQGSVLGPLLFNIFSSAMSEIFSAHDISAYWYADDTQFYVEFDPSSPESERNARSIVTLVMSELIEWMSKHHLKLNTNKTVFLPICRDTSKVFGPLLVGTDLISPSLVVRNLGFIFNRSLSLADHIKHVKKTSFFYLKRILNMRSCTSFKQREMLVHAYVSSRLDFCNSLFYGATKESFNTIQSVFNSTAKALLGAPKRSPSLPILKKLHWLPLERRIVFKLALTGHRLYYFKQPTYMSERIFCKHHTRDTRGSTYPILTSDSFTNRSRGKYGDRSAYYSICQIFNNLPSKLREIECYELFKASLKHHLFSTTF